MKVAIISTGLGHVQRGVEAWARATAEGLTRAEHGASSFAEASADKWSMEQRAEVGGRQPGKGILTPGLPTASAQGRKEKQLSVTLYAGAVGAESMVQRAGAREQRSEVGGQKSEIQVSGSSLHPSEPCTVVLPCLKRGSLPARMLARIAPGFTWRWGWKSPYGIEQYTFAKSLIRELKTNPVDIVHTQDVIVAQMLQTARRKGLITAKTILAHGTEESVECLKQFEYLQELSPAYAERWGQPPEAAGMEHRAPVPVRSTVRGAAWSMEHRAGEEDRGPAFAQKLRRAQQKSEVRSLRAEDGGRRTEDRRQRSEVRDQKTEDGGQGAVSSEQSAVSSGRRTEGGKRVYGLPKYVFMIPNFVDTHIFCPPEDGSEKYKVQSEKESVPDSNSVYGLPCVAPQERSMGLRSKVYGLGADLTPGTLHCVRSKAEIRKELGIAEDAFVIGCVAALQSAHKRLDVLIREVAGLRRDNVFLLLAGASAAETPLIEAVAQELLPNRHLIMKDRAREDMPDVYRCMDLYVHPAEKEIFGICLLEAMASGIPVVAHNSAVMKWVVGEGGWNVDVMEPGFIQQIIGIATTDEHGFTLMRERARKQVEQIFSSEAVIPQFVEMYSEVMRS